MKNCEESDVEDGNQICIFFAIFRLQTFLYFPFQLYRQRKVVMQAAAGGFGNMQEMFANLNSGAASKSNFTKLR